MLALTWKVSEEKDMPLRSGGVAQECRSAASQMLRKVRQKFDIVLPHANIIA